MKKYIVPFFGLAISVSLVLSACNMLNSNSKNTTPTSISFVTGSSVLPVVAPAMYGSTSSTNSTSTIVIDTAKILIRKLQFHGTNENDSSEVDFEDGNGHKQGLGPFVVNLNLNSATVTPVGLGNVPHGSYDGISFQIHKLTPGDTVSDPDFTSGPGENQQYSVVVKGTYNGQAFVYKSRESYEVKISLNPPLVVNDSLKSYNATIQVNVNSWFIDENGNTLNPTDTTTTNISKIDDAISRSFHGFDDNNENGHDDHSGNG